MTSRSVLKNYFVVRDVTLIDFRESQNSETKMF
jgi:hypothetical protein